MKFFNGKLKKFKDTLIYIDGILNIEEVSGEKITERFKTPVFIFSAKRLIDNLKTFSSTFKKYIKNIEFFYPYRTNYLPYILKFIHHESWGALTISLFEYKLAEDVGAPKIILNGFNRKIYEKIVNNEKLLYIVADSFDDLLYLNEIGKKINKTINIGIKLFPKLKTSKNHILISPGFKLGYDIESGDGEEIVKKASKLSNIRIIAFNTHIAIREISPTLHTEALYSLITFADDMHFKHNVNIKYINIGGGFESRSLLEEKNSLEEFATKFKKALLSSKNEYTLILEPGRYVINDAGIVITQVISKKINNKRKWLITDVGVNTLIPLKNASYDVVPLIYNGEELDIVNIGDYIASSIGIIKENAQLPFNIFTNKYLVVLYTGAYTLSMAEQFCLLRPTVILIEGKNIKVLKEEEDIDSFIGKLWEKSW